jgi:hypothetical protein
MASAAKQAAGQAYLSNEGGYCLKQRECFYSVFMLSLINQGCRAIPDILCPRLRECSYSVFMLQLLSEPGRF